MAREPQGLQYISMEERPQPRIRFVGVTVDELDGGDVVVKVELEGRPGTTILGQHQGSGADLRGVLDVAARATLNAVDHITGADPGEMRLLRLQTVRVFSTPAMAVSIEASVDDDAQHMVGFCVLENELPARAAALAVLNGVNRFLGGTIVQRGKFQWRNPRAQM